MSTADTWQTRNQRIAELRDRLERLETQGEAGADLAPELLAIEAALVELPADQSAQAERLGRDVFRHLAEAQRWRALCVQYGLDEAASRADALTRELLDRAAEHWHEAALGGEAADTMHDCFRALLETSRVQLGAAPYDNARAASERSGRTEDADPADRFTATKTALRQRFLEALPEPKEITPQVRRDWVRALIDQAEQVLAELDELDTESALARLAIVRDDLAWHLTHVECERGSLRRRLRRKLKRLRADEQERALQNRLEHHFGARLVAASERLILVLICLVLALMGLEWAFDWSPATVLTFHVIDTVACVFFLTEFAIKFSLVEGRGFWFRRHWLIDLIPSIPIGLLTFGLGAPAGGDAIRFGRAARFWRLPRLVRYVRLMRPGLRLLRAIGLLARGIDRLVPRYAALLNRNIVLYPTREELNRAGQTGDRGASEMARLRVELRQQWRDNLQHASPDQRAEVAGQRLDALRQVSRQAVVVTTEGGHAPVATAREMPAGALLQQLGGLQPSEVESMLDEGLIAQLAHIIRVFARRPTRWLPIIRSFVPRLSDEMTDSDVVARAARQSASTLKWWHDLWFSVADVYGTVTPSQFVDRVGTMLVNSSFRPAYRLVMFGGALLLVQFGLTLTALGILQPLEDFLRDFLGPTILVLGSVAVIVLALGWWMKRLAREATEFYERSAEAKFVSLTEILRTRHLSRDAAILHDRVLHDETDPNSLTPERRRQQIDRLEHRLEASLAANRGIVDHQKGPDPLERIVLLSRDWLDGAMFTASDTRTTSQLLGNPAILQLLKQAHRIDRKQQKALNRLDLRRQGTLLGAGPYLWFNFISRACVHSVAMLLVDYNRHAIPLRALAQYDQHARARYQRWLNRSFDATAAADQQGGDQHTMYVTTAFTALHFLDCDPKRDEEIRQRFGQDVLRRMQADRRMMIRRIFGTYPMHERPKEQRVVNLYAFYQSWLAGGRALFLPWFALALVGRGIRGLLRWVIRSVQEIRRPTRRSSRLNAASTDFRTAARKINRVRLPVVLESLRLRAAVDPDYLGASLDPDTAARQGPVQVDADRRFLDLDVEIAHQIDAQQQRARADMRRLRTLIDHGLLREAEAAVGAARNSFTHRDHHRAAASAYLCDYRGVRSHLSGITLLREVGRRLAADALPPADSRPRPLLKRKFHRFWAQHGSDNERQREAAWRAVCENWWGAADALYTWEEKGDEMQANGARIMGELLQHADQLCEQLMTLRTVQTLAVLDVLHYREHVYHLGEYEEDAQLSATLLQWNTTFEVSEHATATSDRHDSAATTAQ